MRIHILLIPQILHSTIALTNNCKWVGAWELANSTDLKKISEIESKTDQSFDQTIDLSIYRRKNASNIDRQTGNKKFKVTI